MKKTIAKIMAAAMVLSAVPAVALPTLTAEAGSLASDVTAATVSSARWNHGGVVDATKYTESEPLNLTGLQYHFSTATVNGTTTDESAYIETNLGAEVLAYAVKGINAYEPTIKQADLVDKGDDTGTVIIDRELDENYQNATDQALDISYIYSDPNSVKFISNIYLDAPASSSAPDRLLIYVNDDAASLAKARALEAGTDSSVIKITARLLTDGIYADPNKVESISLWVRIGAADSVASTNDKVFVELDNGKNVAVPVTLEVLDESSKTVKIVEADPNKTGTNGSKIFTTDEVKGGNLILNTVMHNGSEYKIERIGARVFKGGKFKMVKLENAKRVNNGAFRECKQLKKVIFNDGKKIKKVDSKAFYKCKKLATVKIGGKALKQVGKNAFGSTKSNITFKIGGNKTQYNKAVKLIKKSGVPKKAKYAKI